MQLKRPVLTALFEYLFMMSDSLQAEGFIKLIILMLSELSALIKYPSPICNAPAFLQALV